MVQSSKSVNKSKKLKEAVRMKIGRPTDNDITEKIYDIIRDCKGTYPNRIKKDYFERYERKLSWGTVRNHLDILIKQGRIDEEIITEGTRRTLTLYRIAKETIIN